MRWSVAISGLAALATAIPAIARAESWCIRDSTGVTSEICAFSSSEDCIRAALVGPSGGIVCTPERRPGAKSNERLNKHRAAPLKPQENH
jgi:hypothetical protein